MRFLQSLPLPLQSVLLLVPANRIGFARLNMGQPLQWGDLRAGLCLVGAVYFIFPGA